MTRHDLEEQLADVRQRLKEDRAALQQLQKEVDMHLEDIADLKAKIAALPDEP